MSVLDDTDHRAFLARDAHRALDFFDASIRPEGGFHVLDLDGTPLPGTVQELHTTTRLVHSYALAQMAGRPNRAGIVDQGMDWLWRAHRDTDHGGYLWAVDGTAPVDGPKLAYGHVFVLLAASSAKMIGHPDADRLLADITQVLDRHYWDDDARLFRDEFTRDWQAFSTYRGMNANMHMSEALLAAVPTTRAASTFACAGALIRVWPFERHPYVFELVLPSSTRCTLKVPDYAAFCQWLARLQAVPHVRVDASFDPGEYAAQVAEHQGRASVAALFQVSLRELHVRTGCALPPAIESLLREVESRGMAEQGIYRISGRSSHSARLRAFWDVPGADLNMAEIGPADLDVHSVCSVLKMYMRELPERLVPLDLAAEMDGVVSACAAPPSAPSTSCCAS